MFNRLNSEKVGYQGILFIKSVESLMLPNYQICQIPIYIEQKLVHLQKLFSYIGDSNEP